MIGVVGLAREECLIVQWVALGEVFVPAALHFHAAGYLDTELSGIDIHVRIIIGGARRSIATILHLSELYHDVIAGMVVLISPSGIEHLLQLAATGGIGC